MLFFVAARRGMPSSTFARVRTQIPDRRLRERHVDAVGRLETLVFDVALILKELQILGDALDRDLPVWIARLRSDATYQVGGLICPS